MSSDYDHLRIQLIEAMKSVFGLDQRRIDHALQVLSYAEQILQAHGGDPVVIRAAAILHDIGIQQAEKKHGSSAGRYQEIEGPPIARQILQQLEIDPQHIEHICRIVASHHSARDIDTPEFRAVWDADWIVNIPEVWPNKSPAQLRRAIEKTLRTPTGQSLAIQIHCPAI